MFNPEYVPVGIDQEQHMEITRYVAKKINTDLNSHIFNIPKSYHYKEETLLGTDNRKMSKSYNNIIPLFNNDLKKLRKSIFSIATNSKNIGEPKFENESAITNIFKFLSTDDEYNLLLEEMKYRYWMGRC